MRVRTHALKAFKRLMPGSTARAEQAYRLHLKAAAEERGVGTGAMQASVFYGSKCNKSAADRRPRHGGKVHW